jgi:hypothetical protein
MTKNDVDFETWFELLKENLNDRGVVFQDADSVREDYDNGRDMFDVVDEIDAEYM